MDIDTLILLILTICALCWWFAIRINEDRQYIKECNRQEKERQERAERVRRLTNRY